MYIGGQDYFSGLLGPSYHGYSYRQFLTNLESFAFKGSPLIAIVVATVATATMSARVRQAWANDEKSRFVLIGFACATLLTTVTSTKIGSGDYYYFVFSYYAALVGVKGFVLLEGEQRRSNSICPIVVFRGLSTLGWLANIVAVIVVLVGFRGVVSVREQNNFYVSVRECVQQLPKPVFIDDGYLSLPWMNPSKINFVLSWSYPIERRRGMRFERGGIGGLITEGYFESLLLNSDSTSTYDGAGLGGYVKAPSHCDVWGVAYLRKPL